MMPETPNRYGARGITNAEGDTCCCHGVALSRICKKCEGLQKTKRQPTLVGTGDVYDEFAPTQDLGPLGELDELDIDSDDDTEPEGSGSVRA